MKKIILSILKCFLYVFILGLCQSVALDFFQNDELLSTIFGSILFVAIVILIFLLRKEDIRRRLNINKISLKVVVIALILSLIVNFAVQAVQLLFPSGMREEMISLADSNFLGRNDIVCFLAMVVFAPLSEEFLFRGVILEELKRSMNIYVAIFLQALVFGVIHGNIIWGIIAFLSGVFYGVMVQKYNSLYVSVIGHTAVNLLSFIL